MSPNAPTDDDLPPLNATPPGLYRHYKGGWYEVIAPPALAWPGPPRGCDRSWGGPANDPDTVRCSETLQGMTLYRALYGGFGLWVRPAAMFNASGLFDGKEQPRFARHDPATVPLGELPTAHALIAHLRGLAQRRCVDLDTALRPPPPEPTTCCGRGAAGRNGPVSSASRSRLKPSRSQAFTKRWRSRSAQMPWPFMRVA